MRHKKYINQIGEKILNFGYLKKKQKFVISKIVFNKYE